MLQGNEVVREGLETSLHTKFIGQPGENFNTTGLSWMYGKKSLG